MLCPFCNHENTKVLESRLSSEKSSVRRRRECENCQKRFTTYEKIETCSITVIKKDRSKEKFSREKLLKSMANVCIKTGIDCNTLEKTADKIESEISISSRRELTSNFIGEKVLQKLKELNEIAYLRYLSAFRNYENLKELLDEVKSSQKIPALV